MEVWNLQQGKYEVRCFETASVFSDMTCEALQWSLWQKYNLLDKSGSGRSSWRWGHFPQVICLRAAPWAVPHNKVQEPPFPIHVCFWFSFSETLHLNCDFKLI